MTYWWLSFTDNTRAEGDRFLGGCIIEASSFGEAINEAWRRKINPGGEVMGFEVPCEYEAIIPRFGVNRLLSKDELNALGVFSERDRAEARIRRLT